jgi:ribonuclease PH
MDMVYTSSSFRSDGRKFDEMREVKITRNFVEHPAGSCLIEFGKTKVLCTASLEARVPKWIHAQRLEHGWVTGEYSMLPAATGDRKTRESVAGKIGGRTHEISRLIGRSLRTVVDLQAIRGLTISIDCDVLQADGGTRTASITGGWVALADAVAAAKSRGYITNETEVLKDQVSSISVGLKNGKALLDLDYLEDSSTDTDLNVVMTGNEKFIEIQGTGEKAAFSTNELLEMLELAKKGCSDLRDIQKQALRN